MKTLYFLFLTFISTFTFSQKTTISGYVKDVSNGEALVGVNVFKKGTTNAVQTNEYGYFSLTVNNPTDTVAVSYLGYQAQSFVAQKYAGSVITVKLETEGITSGEVEVTSQKADHNITSTEVGVNKVELKTIQKMPAFLGEVDVIKSIQLLPGVSSIGEGATGFNVRGGNIDQNLILLDDAPVFNASHLFGFFSIFNPDAVKDVKLIKGGIPSVYGGRASSVLDIRMKEGNSERYQINGGIGSVFSRLSIEGPLGKNASIILAGRRSYLDVLARPFLPSNLSNGQFYFYDFTGKVNWRINNKNTIFVSSYVGRDVFGAGFTFNWGNSTTTARWTSILSPKLFLNTTVYYSHYNYEIGFTDPTNASKFNVLSDIFNVSPKVELTYNHSESIKVKGGIQSTYYTFLPGKFTIVSADGVTTTQNSENRYALESGAYIDCERKINSRLSLQYGLRFSNYNYLGERTVLVFRDTTPNTTKPIAREYQAGNNEIISTYNNWEPRFNMNYKLNQFSSIKLGYNRMSQYLQMVSNTAASTPLDTYLPATNNIKPMVADQLSIGYFRNFLDNLFETSVEVYYKEMANQLDYIDNARLTFNKYLEADLLQGQGRAYGIELYVKKTKGFINGWISYTFAKTERKVEGISNDQWFNSRFDRPHNLALVVIYDVNKKLSFSTNFTYQTGTPATFPTSKMSMQGLSVPYNTDGLRNNYRNADYIRFDWAITYHFDPKTKYKIEQNVVLSVYNVFERRNTFSTYFRASKDMPNATEAVRYSVVGAIIPSITYNFKF